MKESLDLYKYEKEATKNGYLLVAGTDEAGRGPLAGSVFCAAVILNPKNTIDGLNDSKKLSKEKRERLYNEIKKKALAYSIVEISSSEIDRINILEASRLGMEKAISILKIKPDYILTDYMDLYNTDIPFLKLAHGDALSTSIGAASILAKVERDNYMIKMDKIYPNYNFKNNKGYPTKDHIEALKKYGPTEIHRFSFKPIKEIKFTQLELKI